MTTADQAHAYMASADANLIELGDRARQPRGIPIDQGALLAQTAQAQALLALASAVLALAEAQTTR